nr:reverse transcriptase domain-containing protein [Tanacetum cinerariifolium]
MSSPNHPTFDIEDAFSSNSPDYTPASPEYFSASPRNTSSDSSNNSYGLVPIASPTLSLFHDEPYMKVMHAYDTIMPPQELLPPKEQVSNLTSSSTDLSNPSRKQACILVPPSFLVYTPIPPQIFEIGKSYIKMHLKHHGKQIEDILNYLEELSFHLIEKMKERLVNGWMIIQTDFDELKTELEKVRFQISRLQKKHIGQKDKVAFARFRISTLEITLKDIQARHQMAPKRTSTSARPAMNQSSIRQLIDDRIAAALEAQAANMENTDNKNRNPKPRETPTARKCTYKEFMSCQPFYFNGTEVVVGLIRWFEQTESMFSRSNCTEECRVKFATVKKMKDEFYNLVVKGNDLKTYARRFQELAVLCPNMVPNTEKLMEVFIGGLPRSIEGNVTASKPQTLEEAINITQRLMDQVTKYNSVQRTNNHKRKFNDSRNTDNNNYPMIATMKTITTIATTTTIKITVITTIITVTMTTTNSRIEGKKTSELILSTQLRTVGMLETFPCVVDVDYIT